jgi:hypothetical protein
VRCTTSGDHRDEAGEAGTPQEADRKLPRYSRAMKIDERATPAETRNLRRMQSNGESIGVVLPQSLVDVMGWKQMDALRFDLATDDDGIPIGILVRFAGKPTRTYDDEKSE